MKRRTGMKSTRERAKTAVPAFARDRFHAVVQFRGIRVLDKPGNSELP
jgi:hypothetical protein